MRAIFFKVILTILSETTTSEYSLVWFFSRPILVADFVAA